MSVTVLAGSRCVVVKATTKPGFQKPFYMAMWSGVGRQCDTSATVEELGKLQVEVKQADGQGSLPTTLADIWQDCQSVIGATSGSADEMWSAVAGTVTVVASEQVNNGSKGAEKRSRVPTDEASKV